MVNFARQQELKSGWKWVKFGDVVKLSTARCNDPLAQGIERYVGLEHIDSDDLRIQRWGLVEDGITFTSLFKHGQVLFGKRRAYLRKVAVPDFAGVCSGDIYVFESANPQVLLPELLPFICQTDRFFEYAIGTSAGSLSPRTNWKSLVDFEFALPSLEEQKKIVLVLAAATQVKHEILRLMDSINNLRNSLFTSLFSAFDRSKLNYYSKEIDKIQFPVEWRLVEAEKISIATVTKGATPSNRAIDQSTGIPFIKVYNLTFDGSLNFANNPTFISEVEHAELGRSTVIAGDILMNIVGPPLGKVSVVPLGFPEANINQAIVRYRPQTNEIRTWLLYYLQSSWAKSWFSKRSKKTSGQENLTLELCRGLPVPLPPQEQLTKIIEQIECMEKAKKNSEMRLIKISEQIINISRSISG